MKTFLNTLQVSAAESSSNTVETNYHQSEESIVIEESTTEVSEEWGLQVIRKEQTSLVAVSSVVTAPDQPVEHDTIDSSEATSIPSSTEQTPDHTSPTVVQKNPSHGRLVYAIRTKNPEMAQLAFRECLQNDVTISSYYLVQLFNVVIPDDLITALAALKHYRQVTGGEPANSALYARLCEQVGKVDWTLARTGQFTKMVNDLREELVELPERDYQRRCFPHLLVSLVQQPMHRIGRMARGLYSFMVKNDFPMPIGKMRYILSISRYTRQDDLPFPAILSRLAETGKQVL